MVIKRAKNHASGVSGRIDAKKGEVIDSRKELIEKEGIKEYKDIESDKALYIKIVSFDNIYKYWVIFN